MAERTFSFSRIQDYSTCPQRYYFRRILKIVPKEKSKALSLGWCISRGLEAYRRGGSFKEVSEAFTDAWNEEGQILRVEFDPEYPKDFRTVKRGLEILKDYMREYPDEASYIIEPEVTFKDLELGSVEDTRILLQGRIDGILKIGGDIGINEDKTTASLGPTYLPKLRNTLQIHLYLWAADVQGLFKIGGKNKVPKCLLNAIKSHPTEHAYDRDIVLRSRPFLELARQNALNWVKQILLAEEHNLYPLNDLNTNVCNAYGGCDYLPLRYAVGSVRENLIENEYAKREDKKL